MTFLAGTTSYLTVEEADTLLMSTTWAALTTEAKELRLMKATRALNQLFRWRGRKSLQTNPLPWPRVSAEDDDGYLIDGIPDAVKLATALLADKDEVLVPDLAEPGVILSESDTVGEISTSRTYAFKSQTKLYTEVELVLRGYVEQRGTLERA